MSHEAALSPLGEAIVGAVGGMLSNAVVYPLDTIKTKIQADTDAKSVDASSELPKPVIQRNGAPKRLPGLPRAGFRSTLRRIMRDQGVAGFYRGFAASMLNSGSMTFAYFYWYTVVRRWYMNRLYPSLPGTASAPVRALNTITELALGALAGALAQIFTIPVAVIATRQQLETRKHAQSLLQTARDVVSDDGITGLWRGLKPGLILTVNPAITYGVFERIKTALLDSTGAKMTPGKAFMVGALSKTLATVVTFPYILAKTRLQAKYDLTDEAGVDGVLEPTTEKKLVQSETQGKRKERYTGAFDVLGQLYKEGGIPAWYGGMQMQIIKAVLAQALLFGIKDALEGNVKHALVLLSRTTGRAIGIKELRPVAIAAARKA